MDLLSRTFPAEITSAISKYPADRQASAVIRLLYLAQAAYGRLSDEAIVEVAEILAMDSTMVRGVAGFYTLLMEAPHGGFVVQYCNDLPCALRGAQEFLPTVCQAVGCEPGETSADGLFTLQTVMCLAACDRAPMMQVNLEYFFDLTPESLAALVADLRAKAAAGPPRRPPFGFGPPSEMNAATNAATNAQPTNAQPTNPIPSRAPTAEVSRSSESATAEAVRQDATRKSRPAHG